MRDNKVFWAAIEDDNFKMFDMNKIICVKKCINGNGLWKVYLEGEVEIELTEEETALLYGNVIDEYKYYENDLDDYKEDNKELDASSKTTGEPSLFGNNENKYYGDGLNDYRENNKESDASSKTMEESSLFGNTENKINW